MAVWSPLLLRVVLSIALVLNGIGGAIAATRMHAGQMPAAEHVSSPMSTSAATAMPCDEHPAAPGKSPAPDCCKSGVCACACAHIAQIALPVPAGAMPVPNRSLAVKPLQPAHAAPALPHLIRPPIG